MAFAHSVVTRNCYSLTRELFEYDSGHHHYLEDEDNRWPGTDFPDILSLKSFRADKMEPAYARRGRDWITAIFAYDDAIANTGNIVLWFVELRSRTIRSTIVTHHDAIRHHCNDVTKQNSSKPS